MTSAEGRTSAVVADSVAFGVALAVRPSAPSKRAIWRSRLVTALFLAGGLAIFAGGLTIRAANLHVSTVLSNSMQPTFSAGDMVVTQTISIDALHVGDVITFMQPGTTRVLIHRISSFQDGVITTRGDANSVDDPWKFNLTGPTANRLVAVVPYVGWLTQLQRPALLLAAAFVCLAILLELGKEVGKRLDRHRTQPQS